jgi:hypothetical protein
MRVGVRVEVEQCELDSLVHDGLLMTTGFSHLCIGLHMQADVL